MPEVPEFPRSQVDREAPLPWKKQSVDEATFKAVFAEAIEALQAKSIPYVLGGGIASALLGRPRYTRDIDLFLKQGDATAALDVLADNDFETQETNPHWLYKAVKDRVLVDLIFRSTGDMYVDDEMISRAVDSEFEGIPLKVMPPEDLVVIKAAVHSEELPHHWHDCLGVLARSELDWDYLLGRANQSARRMLSLLTYAQSNDVVVPNDVILQLVSMVYGSSATRP